MVGTILDKYGARAATLIGSFFLAVGSILMATAFWIPEFDGYIAGNILLSLGGTFVFVPSYTIGNAFPKHSGIIVAMVTGAFDASVSGLDIREMLFADVRVGRCLSLSSPCL